MHEGRGSGRTDRIGLPEGERLTRETKNVQTQIDSTPRARGDSSLQTQCSSPRTQGAARGRLCGLPPSPGLGGGGRGGRRRPRPRRNGQPSCAAGRTFSGRKDENRQGPHPPSAAIAGGAQGPPAAAQAAEDVARWPRAGRACRLSHAGHSLRGARIPVPVPLSGKAARPPPASLRVIGAAAGEQMAPGLARVRPGHFSRDHCI